MQTSKPNNKKSTNVFSAHAAHPHRATSLFAMILLENSTTTITETLEKKLILESFVFAYACLTHIFCSDKYESCNVSGCDFDGASYLIKSSAAKDQLNVSIRVAGGDVIASFGMDKILKGVYGDLVIAPEKDFTATLQINLKGLTAEKKGMKYSVYNCVYSLFDQGSAIV